MALSQGYPTSYTLPVQMITSLDVARKQ